MLLAVDPASLATATFSVFTESAVNAGTVGHIPILDQMAVRYFVAADTDIAGKAIEPAPSSSTVTLAPEKHARCEPLSGPLRAVTIRVAEPLRSLGPAGVTVHVSLHTPRGNLTGARYMRDGLNSASLISIAIPGEDLTTSDSVTPDVWASGVSGTFALHGNGVALSCGEVVPTPDELKLVSSAAGAIIYQRLTSLPRIRWASASLVQPNPVARVAQLKAGIGPDAVVLNTAGPAASGRSASVRVTADDGDTIAVTADASGMGYLVVADSLQQPGWLATVDGKSVRLLPADHAMVAVPVSAGHHQVELSYVVPGQLTGILVTGGGLTVCVGIVAFWWWRRRSDRAPQPRI